MDMEKLPDTMKLYSLKDAAAILGVTVRSMHRYLKDGRLQGQRVGRLWRISHKAINDFLAQGMEPTLADCLVEERGKMQENAMQSNK